MAQGSHESSTSTGAPRPFKFMAGTSAVVTGGASGIGKATARALSDVGAHVIVFDRDGERLTSSVVEDQFLTPVVGDVSNLNDCMAVADAVRQTGKPLRVLVNCAAYFGAEGVAATPDDWDLSFRVNVRGTAMMGSTLLPQLASENQSAIVNLASVSAYIAQPDRWTYNATKGAILSLTRCQALDLAPHGIRVNSVSPGTIWTEELERITRGRETEWKEKLGGHHILNRVGEPNEVADAIVFLCSPSASFITGADLVVDGGYLARGHDDKASPLAYR